MSRPVRRRTLLLVPAVLLATATAPTAQAQVQQGAAAAGTMALANLPAGARDAILAAIDARQNWNFLAAYEHANRALSIDSTFGLARLTRVDVAGAATTTEANAEYARATRDAFNRGVGEATYLSGLRATGVNSTRLLATAREMLPNDRRVALDLALSYVGNDRVDSLRSLVRQYPDFLAPRLWLAYWLTNGTYGLSPAQLYEGVVVAENAVRIAPREWTTHAALGWTLRMQGRLDESAAHNVAATRIEPRNEIAYSTLANTYIRDGKPRAVDRARTAADSAIAFGPNVVRNINYRREKAIMLFYDGRKTQGYTELAAVAKEYEAAGIPGTAAVVYSQMAGLAGGCADSAKVEGFAAEARRVAPNANVAIQLSHAYALSKNGAAARRELDDFVRRAADTTTVAYKADLRRITGMTLVAEGKAAEGLAMLQQTDPAFNPYAELGIADAYAAMGNKAQASAILTSVATRKTAFNSQVSTAIAACRIAPQKR
jgi:tetratricopeptide (TPR) repeat protein